MAIQPAAISTIAQNRSQMTTVNVLEEMIDNHINTLTLDHRVNPADGFDFPLEGRFDVTELVLGELRARYVGWEVTLTDRSVLNFVPRKGRSA